jgi:hypothetical protein
MGIMSLSYMLGDAVIRIVFGAVLDAGAAHPPTCTHSRRGLLWGAHVCAPQG